MVISNKTLNPINTYFVVPPSVALVSTPTKVLNKSCKTRRSINLDTIKRSQSYTTSSSRFLSTALHSVSRAIIHAQTDKIDLYNKSDTTFCADSGTSEDMLPDYYTFKTYRGLSNRCATLGETTKLPIEGILTTIYTLNGQTILTCNTLHIPVLCGPLYSLHKNRQQSGCGV